MAAAYEVILARTAQRLDPGSAKVQRQRFTGVDTSSGVVGG